MACKLRASTKWSEFCECSLAYACTKLRTNCQIFASSTRSSHGNSWARSLSATSRAIEIYHREQSHLFLHNACPLREKFELFSSLGNKNQKSLNRSIVWRFSYKSEARCTAIEFPTGNSVRPKSCYI